ncbi:hypothetical protein MTO96_009711 [Rhipicephalus appendiculatus]
MAIRRQVLSLPQTGPVFCRLCFKGQEMDALMVACLCSGDNGYVHKTCIERSLTQSGVTSCESCGYRFRIRTQCQPLLQWLVSVECREDVVMLLLNLILSFGDVLAFTFAWLRALTYLEQEQGAPRAANLLISALLSCITCFWSWFLGYRLWYFTEPIRRWRRDTSTICVLSAAAGRRGALEELSKEPEVGSLGQLACDSHGDEQCLTGSQSRQVLS